MSKTIEQLKQEYRELDKEAAIYNRPEFDEVYRVISELTKDGTDIGDGGNLAYPLVEGAIIDEALRLAGYADNETFVAGFKKYREIEQRAREVQLKGLELELPNIMKNIDHTPIHSGEWYFVPIKFIAPPQMLPIIEEIQAKDAKEGVGLYANTTNTPLEDESDDDWFGIVAYGIKCNLEKVWRELQRYGVVDAFLSDNDFKTLYKRTLKDSLIGFIADNTDKPNKVRNHITATMQVFDDMPIYGLIFQLLLLQSLCKWLECININEGDDSYNSACELYEWLLLRLSDKLIMFSCMQFGKGDLQRLEPLCNYLYSTDIGKLAQKGIREKFYPELQNEENQPDNPAPQRSKELNNPKMAAMFTKAVEAGLMEQRGEGYKWRGQVNEFAAFVECCSATLDLRHSNGRIKWNIFKEIFGMSNNEIRNAQAAKRDYDGEYRAKPDKWDLILNICK